MSILNELQYSVLRTQGKIVKMEIRDSGIFILKLSKCLFAGFKSVNLGLRKNSTKGIDSLADVSPNIKNDRRSSRFGELLHVVKRVLSYHYLTNVVAQRSNRRLDE